MKPVVFETTAPASGASGNPAGLVMPRLDADETPAARFHRNAYIHTIRLLNGMPKDVFNPCGVIRATTSDKERVRRQKLLSMAALPRKWMDDVGDGLLFPQGGVVDPPAFVRALLSDAEIRIGKVDQLRRVGTSWRVQTTAGEEAFDAVMIANGLDALKFVEARGLPLAGSAGQIDWFPDAAAPETALAFGPYAAPAPKRGLVIGATYAPIAIGAEPRFSPEATQSNLDAVRRAAPNVVKDLAPSASRPRVSVRCTTPDRLPIAGPVPDWGFYAGAYDGLRTGARRAYPAGRTQDGLFVLTGLGSRGLVTAPLCAAIIAAEIAGAPAPVEADIAEALHPARFYIRDLKRNR
jgi:tRNA 5-methylaminomethyl-2-thiouridine biosynthesis bifunctional protein